MLAFHMPSSLNCYNLLAKWVKVLAYFIDEKTEAHSQ